MADVAETEDGRTTVDFMNEARASLREVAYAIKEGVVSGHLPNSTACVYINITTMEGERYCIRLSMRGFEVVGCEYDRLEQEEQPDCLAFETVYSLLSHISPSYVSSFHHALSDKLDRVKNTSNPGTVEPSNPD